MLISVELAVKKECAREENSQTTLRGSRCGSCTTATDKDRDGGVGGLIHVATWSGLGGRRGWHYIRRGSLNNDLYGERRKMKMQVG